MKHKDHQTLVTIYLWVFHQSHFSSIHILYHLISQFVSQRHKLGHNQNYKKSITHTHDGHTYNYTSTYTYIYRYILVKGWILLPGFCAAWAIFKVLVELLWLTEEKMRTWLKEDLCEMGFLKNSEFGSTWWKLYNKTVSIPDFWSKYRYLLTACYLQSSEFREECPLCLEVDNQWEFSDAWLRLFVPLHLFSSNVAREDFVKEPCGCAFNHLINPIRFDPTVGQSLEASWHQPSNPIQSILIIIWKK